MKTFCDNCPCLHQNPEFSECGLGYKIDFTKDPHNGWGYTAENCGLSEVIYREGGKTKTYLPKRALEAAVSISARSKASEQTQNDISRT